MARRYTYKTVYIQYVALVSTRRHLYSGEGERGWLKWSSRKQKIKNEYCYKRRQSWFEHLVSDKIIKDSYQRMSRGTVPFGPWQTSQRVWLKNFCSFLRYYPSVILSYDILTECNSIFQKNRKKRHWVLCTLKFYQYDYVNQWCKYNFFKGG